MKHIKLIFILLTFYNFAFSQQKIDQISEKLPQLKVTENIIYVKPDMQIFLPNGAFDLKLKETYKNFILHFISKYDFIDNFMGFDVDFSYEGKPFVGINLYDKVDFKEFFAKQETLYRVQTIAPYIKFKLNKFSSFSFWLGFENIIMTETETNIQLEKGKNVISKIYFLNDTINGNSSSTKNQRKIHLQITSSIKKLGSDYDYANFELHLTQYFELLKMQFLEYNLFIGYPLYSNLKPLSEIYYLGGYRLLKGYKFKEFTAEAIFYNCLKYNIPIISETQFNFLGINWSILTWNVFIELAKYDDEEIFQNQKNIKISFGTGFEYNFTIFKIFPMKVELNLAQATEMNRNPQIYFIISTTYYTWRKE